MNNALLYCVLSKHRPVLRDFAGKVAGAHALASQAMLRAEIARMASDCVAQGLSPQTLGYGKIAKKFFGKQKLIVPIDNCFCSTPGTGPIDGWAVLRELKAWDFRIDKPLMAVSIKKRRHWFDGGCHAEITFYQRKVSVPKRRIKIRASQLR